ncbi:MAG: DUF4982 domain-containing protein [Eubacteriales bacterium]|nr:DUF4982 domain-containing protein [Eubacteriales bacterium]
MRQTIDLCQNWRFHWGEADNAFYRGYDDSAWKPVTLPHDWSVEFPFDQACSSGTGYLPGGIGWYRKTFTLPEDVQGKRVFVTFGGVYQHARVWINSHYLGMRAYGYSSFRHELTGRVKSGENMLCVRAEHKDLADSRWFTGAGIYRGVTLTIVEPAHVKDVYAYTLSASEAEAVIAVTAEVTQGEVSFRLLDDQGNTVASAKGEPEGGNDARLSARLQLNAPHLWLPEQPALYRLACTVTFRGETKDEYNMPFGVRVFRFDPDDGFFLNGENRKLKGVCLHHDAGVLGAAVPETVWAERFAKLKAAGCNAVRFSHNPADSMVLDLCDRMGLMVIEEAFDEWEGCKNKWWQGHNVYPPKHYGYADDFPQWHRQDLAELVQHDRNHPCVILWSIGNEIDYPNDPYVHPSFEHMIGNNDAAKPDEELHYDPNRPDAGRLPVIARELAAIVRENDSSRPVSIALAYPELSNRTGLPETVDVTGYNYMEARYADDHKAYPQRVIFGSENGHTPEAWQAVTDNAFIAGQFLWTGADFLGEAHGWPIRVATPGLLDTANHEKPLYYYRKALWTDELCAKLATSASGMIWDEAFRWHYKEGESVAISCYTNATEATLYVNGRPGETVSIGTDVRATWRIPYTAGTLKVVCRRGWEIAEDTLVTPGAPEKLSLACDHPSLPADGQSVATLQITLTDAQGHTVPDADESVCVQVAGDVTLLGIENGNPQDLTPFSSAARPLYRGYATCYLRAGTLPCEAGLTVWTHSGLRETIVLRLI